MGIELLFLLLPVAALSGWLLGRRDARNAETKELSAISSGYFEGLNFLLNEQPDKAIDVFVHMLEVDSETVDTHFALGNLFRRRGEVDRAIRIHQNLIARPTLNRPRREQALYELGIDYMRAGLLDRAESLFAQLVDEGGSFQQQALTQLMDIYQQERDWHKAIAIGQRLQGMRGAALSPIIAQFFCELAEQALHNGEQTTALRMLRRALVEDRNCVRAALIEGNLELASGDFKGAIRAYKRVEQQDPAYLPEILGPLREVFSQQGRDDELREYLQQILQRHGNASIMLTLAELIRQQEGDQKAIEFIAGHLRDHPSIRGMCRLIEMKLQASDGTMHEDLQMFRELIGKSLEAKPVYRCSHCGYTGKALVWQCPSCRQWNTTKPIHNIESE